MSAHIRSAAIRLCSSMLLISALFLSACHVTPYPRTLPDWVQRVSIPMAKNQTAEPGLEELVTKAFQTEVVADGRLELTGKSRANAVLQVTIHSYKETSQKFESDDVEKNRNMRVEMSMEVFDPKDLRTPIGKIDKFTISLAYNSDYRSYSSELDVDAKERLGETTGMRLLTALMSNVKMVNP